MTKLCKEELEKTVVAYGKSHIAHIMAAKLLALIDQEPTGYHVMNKAGEICADRQTLSEAQRVVDDWNASWTIKPYYYGRNLID